MASSFTLESLRDAAAQVHAALPPTPQIRWPLLEARLGTELWVKHENHRAPRRAKRRGGRGP